MLQDMDDTDSRCIFYIKAGTFVQLEESKIYVLTFTCWEYLSWLILRVMGCGVLRNCIGWTEGFSVRRDGDVGGRRNGEGMAGDGGGIICCDKEVVWGVVTSDVMAWLCG